MPLFFGTGPTDFRAQIDDGRPLLPKVTRRPPRPARKPRLLTVPKNGVSRSVGHASPPAGWRRAQKWSQSAGFGPDVAWVSCYAACACRSRSSMPTSQGWTPAVLACGRRRRGGITALGRSCCSEAAMQLVHSSRRPGFVAGAAASSCEPKGAPLLLVEAASQASAET